ncbi:MAG: HD domain-containing protein [Clostridium sp.]
MNNNNELLLEMIKYYEGDPKRIQHFLKVYEFSKLIGELENLDKETQFILETSAIVHDIGIKAAEEKYQSSNGKLQEQEGPAIAKDMLSSLGYKAGIIDRVCFLVGHHHTYTNIDGMDYQILVEADFLVNIYEDNLSKEAALKALNNIFRTKAGINLIKTMFAL